MIFLWVVNVIEFKPVIYKMKQKGGESHILHGSSSEELTYSKKKRQSSFNKDMLVSGLIFG